MNLRELPPAARAVASTLTAAVDAAAQADGDALRAAAAELGVLDTEQTGSVLGGVIRALLEQQHPDGLDGDDISTVIAECTRSAAAWLPEVDPHVLLIVLAGALGIHPEESDGVVRPSGQATALHAPLLIAQLLDGAPRRLDRYLAVAFAEIARGEIMEAP